jgi:ring-1,2-phenylacetyl-CoA epoxidase subunit PaaD
VVTRAAIADREFQVWAELARIPDPEIPAISVVDLGVIGSVQVDEDRVRVRLLPTFVGCPAIDVMRKQITDRLTAIDVADAVDVEVSFDPPWTSDRISPEGRERLRLSGFAPPQTAETQGLIGLDDLAVMPIAACPLCGSRNTTLENPFGPTLCRAIYHCANCRQPFEQFKQI